MASDIRNDAHASQHTPRGDARDWVDAHGDALYRYAMLHLRDRDASEDVVQECFLAALSGRGKFAERSAERTWLIGILKHKIVDCIRSRQRAQTTNADLDQPGTDFFDQRGTWAKAPRRWPADPAAGVEQTELSGVLQACLDNLPENLRGAFLLRELEQMDSDEVGQVLGISSANLWQRLHRARLLLRQCLDLNWFRPTKRGREAVS